MNNSNNIEVSISTLCPNQCPDLLASLFGLQMYFVYYIWYFKKNVNQYLKEGKLYTFKKSRFLPLPEKSGVLVNPHFHRAAFRENKADAVESCLDGDLLLLHCSHNYSYFITNIKAICNREILLRKVRFFSRVTE